MTEDEEIAHEMIKSLMAINTHLEECIAKRQLEILMNADRIWSEWVETGETDHLTASEKAILTIQ